MDFSAKSPVIEKLLKVTATPLLLLLVNLTALGALVTPKGSLGKLRPLGETVKVGAMPVPVELIVCGLPPALSLMVNAPVRVPLAVGVKVTLTVQLELVATLAPQLLLCAKSPLA